MAYGAEHGASDGKTFGEQDGVLETLVRRKEPLSKTVRMSSAAALAGLIPHYASFYLAGTPLWTDQIAEWIMARTPSRYAVAVLNQLGGWAKPWADTGGLATLGLILFLSRLAGSFVTPKWRSAAVVGTGAVLAFALTSICSYSSVAGNISFWLPALALAAALPFEGRSQPIKVQERRAVLQKSVQYGLPLLMSSGVVMVAAEGYWRDRELARRANAPTDLFPFDPRLDRQTFGGGLVRRDVTPVQEFYGMSKDAVDPAVDANTWRLTVSVDGRTLRSYTYSELLRMQRQVRYVTLRCISNTLKSDLMGNAQWAGVHLSQLVGRRMLPSSVIEAAVIGVEGHDDSLKLDYAFNDECLLALGMNGKTLSRTHGFPLRLLAPRYYGCRNVKWIREINFVSKPFQGTWQRLGYTNEPVIHIASHVDAFRRDGAALQFGGVSFAGSRGIGAVRVRANGGPWEPAKLEPSLSPYTWTRWIAQLRAAEGSVVEVNAQDGSGVWQELSDGNPFPNGPAGPTIVIARA